MPSRSVPQPGGDGQPVTQIGMSKATCYPGGKAKAHGREGMETHLALQAEAMPPQSTTQPAKPPWLQTKRLPGPALAFWQQVG